MKIRTDFVTNSSSSSFVIAKSLLTPEQLQAFRDLNDYLRRKYFEGCVDVWSPAHVLHTGVSFDTAWCGDCWSITEDDNYIEGFTSMDNGDLDKFVKALGIDAKLMRVNNEG